MGKILVIDDKEDNLISVSAVLKMLIPDCRVITASSGIEGLARAKAESPDTILLDIKMPGMDGYEVCQRLKRDEDTKHIPVIMVTAIAIDSRSKAKGLEVGADAYLTKPYEDYLLAAQVKTALRVKKAEEKLRSEKELLEELVAERTKALRESEEKFAKAFQDSPIWVSISTLDDGRNIEVNETFSKMTGFSREEAIGRTSIDLGLWPDPEEREEVVKVIKEQNGLRNYEITLKTKTGNHIQCLLSSEPIEVNGESCLISVLMDITERKRAEEALRKSEEEAKWLAEENRIMAEIGRIISSTVNIEEVYERFSEELRKLISFGRTAINIINPDQQTVTVAYVWGAEIDDRRQGNVYPLAGTSVEKIMRTQSSLLFQSEDNEEIKKLFPGSLSGFKAGLPSMIAVPLISQNRVIGSLHLRSAKSGAYAERDVRIAERVGRQIAGAIANAQLFLELKRVEKELRESERRYSLIAEHARDVIWTTDRNLRINYVSPSVARVRGYTVKETMAQTPKEVYTPESLQLAMEVLAEELSIEQREDKDLFRSRTLELEVKCKDGSTHWSETRLTFLRNDDGQYIGILGVGRDINERKRAEEALRKSEEEAKRLAEENRIMAEIGRIISSTLNIEEVYERFAKVAQKLIHFDRLAINTIRPKDGTTTYAYSWGVEVPERRPGKSFPLAGTITGELMHTRQSLLFQTDDPKKFLERFPFAINLFSVGFRSFLSIPLISRDQVVGVLHFRSLKPEAYTENDVKIAERVADQIAGAIANAQLFSERQRIEKERLVLEEQLRQAQKMEAIGTLAGGIAHDFNNILAGILGYAELASLDIPEGSNAKYNLQQSIKSTYRARDLVQQILAFSRQSKLERKPLDIRPIIKEALKLLRASLPSTIEIRQDIEGDLGIVEADPTQIHQVLMNLCTNAAHAMSDDGGVLEVSLTKFDMDGGTLAFYPDIEPGPYLKLRVSDTGHGIPPEILQRIFDPYFTTKEPGKGTGLGLAVVHGIVKSHGGAIGVASEPGKGTSFDVYLPWVDIVKRPVEVERLEPLPLGGRERVIFIDDEQAIVEIGQKMLERLGYEVVGRTSSVEALELFRAKPESFDLVITDMTMPNMTGDKLAQELLGIRPDIPIILCTGFSEHITEEKARTLGVREFALKPLVMQDLAKSMRRALRQKKKKKG